MTGSKDLWQCQMLNCSYVYNPYRGDKKSNIPSGTPFEELPKDWNCPLCGMGKELFRRMGGGGPVKKGERR